MIDSEALKIFEKEVIILNCLIDHDKYIIADCDTEDDEFDDCKELAELSLKDYSKRKEAFYMAISALKEIRKYREIGTVEEWREAVERQKPKKPKELDTEYGYFICGNCGGAIACTDDSKSHKYCLNCGQAIQWEESEGE